MYREIKGIAASIAITLTLALQAQNVTPKVVDSLFETGWKQLGSEFLTWEWARARRK
jgi:hypothetical protein